MKNIYITIGIFIGVLMIFLAGFYFAQTNLNKSIKNSDNLAANSLPSEISENNLNMFGACKQITLLSNDIQSYLNGVTCNEVCSDSFLGQCVLGYVSIIDNGDLNVPSQKTGLVSCNMGNGPMNTAYINCLCCP